MQRAVVAGRLLEQLLVVIDRRVVLLLPAHQVRNHEARVSVGGVHAQERRALLLARVLEADRISGF
jgi:hypothetical protein